MTPTPLTRPRRPAPTGTRITEPRRGWLGRLSEIAAGLCLTAGIVLSSGAPAAQAVVATGHGIGHTWAVDGASWIGSYQLADGTMVFCLQAGKSAPVGHDYEIHDARGLASYSNDDAALLAFISRTWADTTDATAAAAAQLATWSITGLNGRSPEVYAARANGSSGTVLNQTAAVLDAAIGAGGASRSVTAAVQLTMPDEASGQLTVTADLEVDFLATGPTVLAAGSHTGMLELTGAVFADGSSRMAVGNAVSSSVTATGTSPIGEVSATVLFEDLPYGSDFRIGQAGPDVQKVLLTGPGSATGSAAVSVTVPSDLPFQPQVVTATSASTAESGAMISDELILSTRAGAGVLDDWGVYPSADDPLTMLPVPVTVESTLLGPFTEPIVLSPEIPENSPVVCALEVVAEGGPGTYRTGECALPGPGYYVWVERIVPSRTPVQAGGDRILPWQSDFGTASEITFVATPVVPVAPADPAMLAETGLSESGMIGGSLLGALLLVAGVLCRGWLPRIPAPRASGAPAHLHRHDRV